MAGLAVALAAWGLWSLFPGVPANRPPADGAAGAEAEPSGAGGGGGDSSPLEVVRSRPRPFARSESVPPAPGPIPWQARLYTNGTLDVDRMRQDEAYARKAIQSDRLKTLIRSPAKDTPECREVVAFVDRKGLPLAATVDLYNILWATRQYEGRVTRVATPAEREPIDVVRDLELTDFRRRFQQDYAVDVAPMLEDLFALPIHPTVFMGVPSRGFVEGEVLLSD